MLPQVLKSIFRLPLIRHWDPRRSPLHEAAGPTYLAGAWSSRTHRRQVFKSVPRRDRWTGVRPRSMRWNSSSAPTIWLGVGSGPGRPSFRSERATASNDSSRPKLSFRDRVRLQDGDVMEVSFDGFGRPLSNSLKIDHTTPTMVAARVL